MRYFNAARRQVCGPRGCVTLSEDQYKLLEAVAARQPGDVTPYSQLYKILYDCDNPVLYPAEKMRLEALISRTRDKLRQAGVAQPELVLETRREHGLTVGPLGADTPSLTRSARPSVNSQ